MRRLHEHGFSLAELAIVLVIVGLLFIFTIPISGTLLNNERRAASVKKMENIQLALVNFAMTNRRLPCPADGTLAGDDALAGSEGSRTGGACTDQGNGVIPWKPLGLTAADATDAWFNRFTYRVAYSLAADNSLDMSNCDPAGTKATNPAKPALPTVSVGLCDTTCAGSFSAANCTSPANFLAQKGLNVSDGSNVVMDYTANTGAAYVLISHGENGYGSLNSTGTYQSAASKGIAGTTLENPNRNLPALSVTNAAPPIFVDASFRDIPDAAVYFDDIIVRPSILMVINKAQLGPRVH